MTQENAQPKKENMLLNLCCNIVIPILILSKLSKPEWLGATWGLIFALLFPLGYGLFFFVKTRKANTISILGFVSILLTGMIGVLELPSKWIAAERALIPALIGICVLASQKTKYPLVKTFLYNDAIFDTEKISKEIEAKNNQKLFDREMTHASVFLALTFFGSAVLNFIIAKMVVVHPTGTPDFNAELAHMKLISLAVIALPSTIVLFFVLQHFLSALQKLSGLTADELYAEALREKMK